MKIIVQAHDDRSCLIPTRGPFANRIVASAERVSVMRGDREKGCYLGSTQGLEILIPEGHRDAATLRALCVMRGMRKNKADGAAMTKALVRQAKARKRAFEAEIGSQVRRDRKVKT